MGSEDKRPRMWIMKITPNAPADTEKIVRNLFLVRDAPNLIGWSDHIKPRTNDRYSREWNQMDEETDMPPLVVIMQGLSKIWAVVVVTGRGFDVDENQTSEDADWFIHRRSCILLKFFESPVDTVEKLGVGVNRDTILSSSGPNSSKILNYVWEELVCKDYFEQLRKRRKDMEGPISAIKSAAVLVKSFKNIILCGPPGTGKTYMAQRIAEYLLGEEEEASGNATVGEPAPKKKWQDNQYKIVQFHPSYSYEDFVRGIRVSADGGQVHYKVENRVFGEMASAARKNPEKRFVLIIDEINRANLATVLGELIYALEYRNEPVGTPYKVDGEDGDDQVVVPDNLYVIGTMNTADKSVGRIDYAIRRRFTFLPCLPDKEVVKQENGEGVCGPAVELFDSVHVLIHDHLAPDFHEDEVQIGHTYFLAKDRETLFHKFAYQVYPLLREYYKDGILVPKDGKLTLDKVGIDIMNPQQPKGIIEKLNEAFPEDSTPQHKANEPSEAPHTRET